jgi:hypothetical protein
MRILTAFVVAALIVSIASADNDPSSKAPTMDLFGFLAGHWRSETDGKISEEVWLAPKAGLMVGTNREVSGDSAFFEFLRIEWRDGKPVYVAQPLGRPPTEFIATSYSDSDALFENEAHDFPKSITYRRTAPDRLEAEAKGIENGKEKTLKYSWTLVK